MNQLPSVASLDEEDADAFTKSARQAGWDDPTIAEMILTASKTADPVGLLAAVRGGFSSFPKTHDPARLVRTIRESVEGKRSKPRLVAGLLQMLLGLREGRMGYLVAIACLIIIIVFGPTALGILWGAVPWIIGIALAIGAIWLAAALLKAAWRTVKEALDEIATVLRRPREYPLRASMAIALILSILGMATIWASISDVTRFRLLLLCGVALWLLLWRVRKWRAARLLNRNTNS